VNQAQLIACRECDLLQRKVRLSKGAAARCVRCGATLYRYVPTTVDHALALACAAAILFIVANYLPIAGLSVNGISVETTLLGAVLTLYNDGMWPIAGLVCVTTFLMPLLNIAAVIYLLAPMRVGRVPCKPEMVCRILRHVAPWGMIEVLMLGLLVTLVKLQRIATVVPGAAMWVLAAVMLLLAAATISFNPRDILTRIGTADTVDIARSVADAADDVLAYPRAITAASVGLCACHDCGLLSKLPSHKHRRCPRCGAALHQRKSSSLVRTWAFIFAAMALYVPALVLPVMLTGTLLGTQPDTIMSGIVYFWNTGSWPLAIIVFIASIAVPLLKIFSLAYLAVSVQFCSRLIPHQRTTLYRLVEFVGRWSMLDIYVITLLVALVKFGDLATIEAGPGAIAFGAVVVLTMFAALSFDPRLIWDPVEWDGVDWDAVELKNE